MPNVLAFDLGAGSGRAILGRFDPASRKLETEEIHRFANEPVQVGERLHWDILRLLHELKQGIVKTKLAGHRIESIAIDSWAVDFGLLDEGGELLGNPYHYRDTQTDGVMEAVTERLGRQAVFSATGVQFLPFNTLYQLHAIKRRNPRLLAGARSLLMIPELLRYFLTGERHGEWTNATTTQMVNATAGDWDSGLLADIGLDRSLLQRLRPAGFVAGTLSPDVCAELGVPPIPVIAVGEHDTASAVAAVPAEAGRPFAYLCSGTWSLLGTETERPVLSQAAQAANFTNEGGVYGTNRLLKNIMGLWLIQECRRCWELEGRRYSYAELAELAGQAEPFRALIDPDDASFLRPAHMPQAIAAYCRATGQAEPETPGQFTRCVMESLALKYAMTLRQTELLAGETYAVLHAVGGGIQNELLCQFAADAAGRPVWAGPAEASAIGNIAVQYITLGHMSNLAEARSIVRASYPLAVYEPSGSAGWREASARLKAYIEQSGRK